ncbi:methylated-DNA--[protein]-cysteine S-methyltransferase [Flavobacterium sp. RNTU_13]|uniref:methylated-DNA--[protein]-cysteine S-methyltransferase n=1 Tax=Flavobacterium sp. RNTU_13 TaxID=3375145 RepID=UPI003987D5C4
MQQAFLQTPLGTAIIEGDENGVSRISITDGDGNATENHDKTPYVLAEAVNQLKAYFDGKLNTFSFKLNPEGTDFQKRVWDALLKIPYGKTTSYQELSVQLGDVKAIRAVASANGKNPLWIVVPCHRVIGSDGSLTGYAGGLWRKKWLLEHETPPVQQSLF